jgi:RNA polymerase sporulation-specific sigma factor
MFLSLLQFFATKFLLLALHLESGSFPRPLSAREETEAFSALRAGDPAAREKLIRHNLRLVAHIVKKYYALPGDQDDLISIGTIGLMKAVDTFDSDRRARFSTYASRCIENAILSPAHFQMEKRTHSFCKAAQMRQNGFSGLRKAVTFFYFKRYHVRVVV